MFLFFCPLLNILIRFFSCFFLVLLMCFFKKKRKIRQKKSYSIIAALRVSILSYKWGGVLVLPMKPVKVGRCSFHAGPALCIRICIDK